MKTKQITSATSFQCLVFNGLEFGVGVQIFGALFFFGHNFVVLINTNANSKRATQSIQTQIRTHRNTSSANKHERREGNKREKEKQKRKLDAQSLHFLLHLLRVSIVFVYCSSRSTSSGSNSSSSFGRCTNWSMLRFIRIEVSKLRVRRKNAERANLLGS